VNVNKSGVYNNDKIYNIIKLNLHPNTLNLFNLNLKKKYREITNIHTHLIK